MKRNAGLPSHRVQLWLLAGLLFAAGCGAPTGQVTGRVMSGQQPVANAELVFELVEDPSKRYFGVSNPDGVYQVDYRTERGLPVGTYKVTVTSYTTPEGDSLPAGEEGEVFKTEGRAVARESVFKKEISKGANTIDFDIANQDST